MPPELTNKAWAEIRHDYEHSDRTIDDICAGHGISAGTLRDRMRRWGWTRRRPPVPREGPACAPPVELDAWLANPPPEPVAAQSTTSGVAMAAQAAPEGDAASAHDTPDETAIVLRLQGAVARLLPAIEMTVATIGAAPIRPREIESGVRALATLTRTLRELNGLLGARQADARASDDDMPEDIDAFHLELARRIDAFVVSRTAQDSENPAG